MRHSWFVSVFLAAWTMTGCAEFLYPTMSPTIAPEIHAETQPPQTATPEPTPYVPSFPEVNPDLPLFTLHIQAVRVADDEGTRAARITIEEIIQWIEEANRIFANASIRFLFDPLSDYTEINSTLLNNMTGIDDPNWDDEQIMGNEIAALNPGKLVVFFRHGPGDQPTGAGFSWTDYNFVAMPGFDTSVCGYQNKGMLGHEIGHYLGLPHTFPKVFPDIDAVESYFMEKGSNPAVFDGDGMSDTAPDPYIETTEIQCEQTETIDLKGTLFTLPRANIMSYYEPRTMLSVQQVTRARYVLALRNRYGMAMPTNAGLQNPYEFETMKVKVKYWETFKEQDMTPFGAGQYSNGKHLFINSAYLSDMIFEFSTETETVYNLVLYGTQAPDMGIFELYVDGILVNDYIDLYAPFVLPSGPIGLGPYYLTAGDHELRIVVKGKHKDSTNYFLGLDAITILPAE